MSLVHSLLKKPFSLFSCHFVISLKIARVSRETFVFIFFELEQYRRNQQPEAQSPMFLTLA